MGRSIGASKTRFLTETRFAAVAQPVEPSAHNGLVAGSSPAGCTIKWEINLELEHEDFRVDAGDLPSAHWTPD